MCECWVNKRVFNCSFSWRLCRGTAVSQKRIHRWRDNFIKRKQILRFLLFQMFAGFFYRFWQRLKKSGSSEWLSLAAPAGRWQSPAPTASPWIRSSGICSSPSNPWWPWPPLASCSSSSHHSGTPRIYLVPDWRKNTCHGYDQAPKRDLREVSAVDIYLKKPTLMCPRHLYCDFVFKPYQLYQDPK